MSDKIHRTLRLNGNKAIEHRVYGTGAQITASAVLMAWTQSDNVIVCRPADGWDDVDDGFGDWGLIEKPATEKAYLAWRNRVLADDDVFAKTSSY